MCATSKTKHGVLNFPTPFPLIITEISQIRRKFAKFDPPNNIGLLAREF